MSLLERSPEIFAERMNSFRSERLEKITKGEVPTPLLEGAKTVLHLVPSNAFDLATHVNVAYFEESPRLLAPIRAMRWRFEYNFDGFLVAEANAGQQSSFGYVQLFRNGCCEVVDASLLHPATNGNRIIPSPEFEEALSKALRVYVNAQQKLKVAPPIYVLLSLLGVSGYRVIDGKRPIDRDELLVPEGMLQIIDDKVADAVDTMLPLLINAIWNTVGLHRFW